MGQDLEGLKKLLTEVSILNIKDNGKVVTLASPELEVRTNTLSRLAKGLGLNPEIISDFDLASVEAKSVEEFLGQAYYRYLTDERPKGQERLR